MKHEAKIITGFLTHGSLNLHSPFPPPLPHESETTHALYTAYTADMVSQKPRTKIKLPTDGQPALWVKMNEWINYAVIRMLIAGNRC